MIEKTWLVILLNLMPTVEQTGAIALGLSLGLSPASVFFLSLLVNCLLFFPIFFGLRIFYNTFLRKIKLFNRYLEKVRTKGKPYVDRYGIIGITLFISLPTPLSGTYTASILAWLLGLEWRKSFLAIFLGSFIGGLIILGACLGVINAIKILLGL
ncbi:MAG: small multi-drug export protein [Candidatus Aenigmarchaeota archaeon]|nr:small multi-drug export protein [Candidatus Aenigmarchaeota archaeon]